MNAGSSHDNGKRGGWRADREEGGRQGRDGGDQCPSEVVPRCATSTRRGAYPPAYIPQLTMEMLCVKNSVYLDRPPESPSPVYASAAGTILPRLERDEGSMNEMKFWLGQFQMRCVENSKIPNDVLFWNDDPGSQYGKFPPRTKELSEGVKFAAYIDPGRIQRMLLERGAGRGGEVPLLINRIVDDGVE
jgi:hypothetical protein